MIAPPAPHRTVELRMADGAIIHVRRHGQPDGPRLVLSHGNGLAIDGYLPFWKPLCQRYEVIVFDFRQHGWNPSNPAWAHDWPAFVDDMERIWRGINGQFGAKPAAGVFHSMSAICSILHSLEYGKRWEVLALFDPPFFARDGHPLRSANQSAKFDLAARARRRRESYNALEEFARQLASIPTFRRWVPEAYELMARATLRRDDASGAWVLACPRELEARIFESTADPTIWPRMARMPVPVELICADPDTEDVGPPALIGRAMAVELPIEYEAVPDTSHFLQIERPQQCIAIVEAFLGRHRFLQSSSRA
jgi:pimeloyl-ACP methyl ester carboxylesterase